MGNIEIVKDKIAQVLVNKYDYEIIFIDDGSTDSTLNILKDLNKNDPSIKYISFSRNFGHQKALKAGIDHAQGDCVISIDSDLQHPPELILDMLLKWKEGYDIVYTKRQDTDNIGFFKRKTSKIFYKILNLLSDIKIDENVADFRLINRSAINVLKNLKESNPFYRGLVAWLGFKQYSISYNVQERYAGKSKYSLRKMFLFALSGITSFSIKPLHFSTALGGIASLSAFIYAFYAIAMKLFTNQTISGWASVLVSVLFLGGVQLISLGIIGEYLGRLFIESKRRPNYIIREKSDELS
jgi:dolichol-phosphate mannosyltransferase